MKKREFFWLSKLLLALIIILFFSFIALNNIFQFNTSYMQEEKEELQIFKRQIEWAIIPFLKNKDYKTLQKYCNDFKNEDITFRIFDNNKKLIATSKLNKTGNMIPEDSKILRNRTTKWKIYRHSIKNKMIGLIYKININNGYYLELTVSEADVIKSIQKGQISIIILFVICVGLLVFVGLETIYSLGKSFNLLNDNVNKIASGELDTNIEVHHEPLLQELTISIKKMISRLKMQIIQLGKLEHYKSEFLQNITHEIKTPLTAINSAIELIENQKEFVTDKNKECLDIIHFQVEIINKLVNDILMLSEIEVAKTEEQKNFKPVNLNNLITKLMDNFNFFNNINLIATQNVEILANEDLLSTAISNLLTNATKYSGSKTIDIILSKNETSVILQVKDYGIGIETQHLKHLFERFYRVDKSRSRQKGGTGLGLAIAKNIIELHNGTIYAESEVNKGTVFTIELKQ